MLGGAADTGGDVELGRDLRSGLSDLVAVWPPAVVGDNTGAADRPAEQPGELVEYGEAFGAADAASAGHDDRRGGQRDPALRCGAFDQLQAAALLVHVRERARLRQVG